MICPLNGIHSSQTTMQHFKHVSGQFLGYTSPSGNATLNFLYTTSPVQLTDTGTRGVDTKHEPPVAFEVNVPQLRAGASSVNRFVH